MKRIYMTDKSYRIKLMIGQQGSNIKVLTFSHLFEVRDI